MFNRTDTILSKKQFVTNLETMIDIRDIGEGGFDFAFSVVGGGPFNSSVGNLLVSQVYYNYDENLNRNSFSFFYLYNSFV